MFSYQAFYREVSVCCVVLCGALADGGGLGGRQGWGSGNGGVVDFQI